jgi:uncharacterized protein with GYD domain
MRRMTEVRLSTRPGEVPDWEAFHALAASYEDREEPILAFGYLLVAASLMPEVDGATAARLGLFAFQTGNFDFALRCFVLAAGKATNVKEKRERTNAVVNLVKKNGLSVTAAELRPVKLDLPPLIERINPQEEGKSRTSLLVAHAADLTENVLMSISEHSSQACHVFRFSEIARKIPMFNADRFLLYLCRDLAPDLMLFRHAELTLRAFDPRVETLKAIKEQLGIPVVSLYYDLAKPSFERLCRSYLPGLDIVVTLDSSFDTAVAEPHGVTVVTGWTPLPQSIYFDDGRKRPIEVGFVGRTSAHYQGRARAIEGLREAGIAVSVHSADEGTRLPMAEMGEFLRSCKIVLNFSTTAVISAWELNERKPGEVPLVNHVKGRVFEAIACGALLLESRNTCTSAYFSPGEHYAEFSDLSDLVEKVRHFIANEDQRSRIAHVATKRFGERYTGAQFWTEVESCVEQVRARARRAP